MSVRIIGMFTEEDNLVNAIHKIKEQSLIIDEIYMPYPVHEALEAVGKKSKLPTAAYFIGVSAVIGVLGFLYFTSVVNWPIVYGGKPFNSFPSFLVVTIILTILSITLGSLFLFSIRTKLWPGQKEDQIDLTVSDNRFAVVMKVEENQSQQVEGIFKDCGAVEIKR